MDTNTDEHDLAKALDSVTAELDAKRSAENTSGDLSFEESAAPGEDPIVLPGSPVAPAQPVVDPVTDDTTTPTPPPTIALDHPSTPTPAAEPSSTPVVSGPLADIKKDAIVELRPLVDKLNVSPEEKFDTYLLLIRSTDDSELIGPAHEAAKAISDETRRAEALLDIIKEIDYLSQKKD